MTFAGHPYKQLPSGAPVIGKFFKFLSTQLMLLKIGVVLSELEYFYDLGAIEI